MPDVGIGDLDVFTYIDKAKECRMLEKALAAEREKRGTLWKKYQLKLADLDEIKFTNSEFLRQKRFQESKSGKSQMVEVYLGSLGVSPCQIKKLLQPGARCRSSSGWTSADISLAVTIYSMSAEIYDFLRLNTILALPEPKILKKLQKKFDEEKANQLADEVKDEPLDQTDDVIREQQGKRKTDVSDMNENDSQMKRTKTDQTTNTSNNIQDSGSQACAALDKLYQETEWKKIKPHFPLCTICKPNQFFTSNYEIAKHYRSHAGLSEFQCHVCGDEFLLQSSITLHMINHTNQKAFECHICRKKVFSPTEFSVQKHMESHGELAHLPCEICQERQLGQKGLRTHMRVWHNRTLTAKGTIGKTKSRKFEEDPSVDIEEMTEIEMLTADDNGKILIPKTPEILRKTLRPLRKKAGRPKGSKNGAKPTIMAPAKLQPGVSRVKPSSRPILPQLDQRGGGLEKTKHEPGPSATTGPASSLPSATETVVPAPYEVELIQTPDGIGMLYKVGDIYAAKAPDGNLYQVSKEKLMSTLYQTYGKSSTKDNKKNSQESDDSQGKNEAIDQTEASDISATNESTTGDPPSAARTTESQDCTEDNEEDTETAWEEEENEDRLLSSPHIQAKVDIETVLIKGEVEEAEEKAGMEVKEAIMEEEEGEENEENENDLMMEVMEEAVEEVDEQGEGLLEEKDENVAVVFEEDNMIDHDYF